MKKLVTIVGISVDAQNAVLYLEDGSTVTIVQGDPRLPIIVETAKKQIPVDGSAVVDIAEPVKVRNEFKETEEGTGGLIKFFRVAKSFIKKFIDTESPEKVDESVAHISPLELGIKPGQTILDVEEADDLTYALEAQPAAVEAVVEAPVAEVTKPVELTNDQKIELATARMRELAGKGSTVDDPDFHKPITDEDPDTIVAVNTQTGSVIPHAHKLSSQMKAASKLKDFSGFVNFINRLEPVLKDRGHSAEDLMKFIEYGDLPIADDGCIVIYKRLKQKGNTFVDVHSGNIKQNVGSYVFMRPGLVDPNRRQDCSNGLHVASLGYLSSFSGNVTVMAKVRPEDVFAVPEYSHTKMRVCGYHILAVLPESLRSHVNSGGSISSIPEGKELLNKVLRGAHVGITELVEVGGHNGSNVTYTKVENTEAAKAEEVKVDLVKETLEQSDLSEAAPTEKVAAVLATDLKESTPAVAPEIKKTKIDLLWDQFEAAYLAEDLATAQKFAEELISAKQKAKKGWAKLGISDGDAGLILSIREASDIKVTTPETKAESTAKPEGKAMTVKEQAQELYRVFKETKAKGNRADTKDAAGELQFFMSSRKKGPKAFGLDPKVSDELKTWLK
ncbi:RIIB lysis inhibitor [Klebsiella phage vB_KpP_FBKp27]|uniref:RIIB-like protein n=1 Tax=Klebsiella phage vB_KpP_FBKp27 TaxID=2801837 RepID=A0A7U0GAG2_9CAUD|nr:RIIB lysis inhibitor [Klebsiella phage vB_KpP_FBKp27]QQV91606.1 RIIB-like protein [Klebsiella phage vB_KpP_FBKp27]